MNLRGIRDILEFLNHLEEKKVFYRIEKDRIDSIMVTYTLAGYRIELDFFEEKIEYSVFSGNEIVLDNQEILFNMIDNYSK